ncbi:hypothetical protein Sste5346_007648 [Sporothrix stenoceras]|uniref:F-box domain-containing protein n=1 Tax=Sporothrix stenoceras TaxID=5173 RepID=A0ABR3YSN9_9PEZI
MSTPTPKPKMITLADLPLEVGTAILSYVSPLDLLNVSLASHGMQSYVKGNSQLHRLVYCNYFDKPAPARADINWEQEIVDFRILRTICLSKSTSKASELDLVARLVKQYLGVACETTKGGFDLSKRMYRNAGHLARLIKGRRNYEAFFCRSFLYDRIRNAAAAAGLVPTDSAVPPPPLKIPPKPLAHHQTSAELHCLLGAVLLKYVINSDSVADAYPYAVSKVYDMREYTRASLWGPFMADGSGNVDWEKVEAIMIVLRSNIMKKGFLRYRVISQYWNSTFQGSSPGSYRPLVGNMDDQPDDTVPLDDKDPYGVTGTWMRLVSFLDYSDFFRFNFPDDDDEPNNVPIPDDKPRPAFLTEEELRMIVMKIHVTRIEWPGKESEGEGDPVNPLVAVDDGIYDNTHPDFPIVYFHGHSNSMDNPWDDNANSGLYGTVRTTKEGHIRWTTFSTFDGAPRWRSEGIQVGGRKSGRGVLGNWFDATYDRQGPCGPTAFWKLHSKKRGPQASSTSVNGIPIGGTVQSFMYLLNNANFVDSARETRAARPPPTTTTTTPTTTTTAATTPGEGSSSSSSSTEAAAPSSAAASSRAPPVTMTTGATTRSMTAAAANPPLADDDASSDDGVFDGPDEEDQQPINQFPTFQEPRSLYTYLELPLGSYIEAHFQIVDELGGNHPMWDSDDDDGPFAA